MTSRTAADSPETVSAEGTADYDHFAAAYADQNDRDYAAWQEQVRLCRSGVRSACGTPAPLGR